MGGEVRAWQSGENALTAYGAFQSNNFSQDEYRSGLEFAYKDLFMLRGGYTFADQNQYLFGPTFGVGLGVPVGGSRIMVDYALQNVDQYFDNLHTFSLKVVF